MRPVHKLLLATVLVLGQWLAIAHDYQHPALTGDETCQACVHGQQHQAGAFTQPALTDTWLTTEAPLLHHAAPVLAPREPQASIRAPPANLA